MSLSTRSPRPHSPTGDLKALERAPNLTTLNLLSCDVCGDIGVLEGMRGLQIVNLFGCVKLTGDLQAFRPSIATLVEVWLDHCKRVKGDVKVFCGAVMLKKLELGGTKASGSTRLV